MKIKFIFYLFLLVCIKGSFSQNSWIRINQVGYKQNSMKIAVLGTKVDISLNNFQLIDVLTGDVVLKSQNITEYPKYACFDKLYRLDFSGFNLTGTYYIKVNNIISPNLIIYTPGTSSYAYYTTPNMGERYLSSSEIYDNIIAYEENYTGGLNGFFLLLNIGTHPDRKDKFYYKLDDLLTELKIGATSFH